MSRSELWDANFAFQTLAAFAVISPSQDGRQCNTSLRVECA